MISRLAKKLFGSRNQRLIKKLSRIVNRINELEPDISVLSDSEFPVKTSQLKERVRNGETLDALLPEAFALVREASIRVLEMRHFDVQMIGGIVLHRGDIAEMKTGEGKTLVATLPAYLNALEGKGVHIITVNDYLAQRDADWMGKVYDFLGMSTGVIISGLSTEQRREAYNCDITYGTNNEFGFDYLRDNLAFSKDEQVQRLLNYAIVDEVDSILIDEARTPLIISGAVDDRSDLYIKINQIIPKLKKQEMEDGPGDYSIDEKTKQAYLTEAGNECIEELLKDAEIIESKQNLYDPANILVLHHINAAIRAHALYHRDVEYLVKDNEVLIVDEFTGRTMPGRRWSEGLHQAIEAKEGVPIQNENQTLASITYQNYFRLYNKLSGMTGTADTEAFEFQQIYGLEVVVIPTHMEMIREDLSDAVYLKATDKFNAIIDDIKYCREKKQPVLVGTASIEVSEYLSKWLDKEKIPHNVLNAKFHQKEAQIIAQAGEPGAVTIATNMAGRGTDIVLGGSLDNELQKIDPVNEKEINSLKGEWLKRHEEVVAAGGLHIIGTERHESRRVDNQLRGRSGRQGDPGSSRFYLSLEDNLMRIFASDRITAIMQKLGMESSEAIESGIVSRAIENAQKKVEAHNFDIRKHLLEFDDVANDQRKVIYEQRNELMEEQDISDNIESMREDVIIDTVNSFVPPGSIDELWDIHGLEELLERDFDISENIQGWLDNDDNLNQESLRQRILKIAIRNAKQKEENIGSDIMRRLEKQVMLDFLDRHWKDHLISMDHLRQGIGLRSYAAKNPKQEYKKESFELFVSMLENLKFDVIRFLSKVQVRTEEDVEKAEQQHKRSESMNFSHPEAKSALLTGSENPNKAAKTPFVRDGRKIGRNEPCPCGSGKKYKQCHGRLN
ncbi:MAG: preprotein translocase subunit SecA [Gammaproteobacteria bacterium]|nr:preprotein translocase subunit SecA [Gammaproteobacteria bacterium]NIN62862.1 preprotein translocase subunit SecA [Gammaproteobacteria bacterium]NIO63843.1 preprotein translocase subunit SecA [Gammaproteobacteria bacterium]NIP50221.1 preprotein translocase subunit SecA [Gammaproteobacteria bacterium]NIQ12439.1 preprotein translocase subunit SecA [Gammaproteobacteria bacterium]